MPRRSIPDGTTPAFTRAVVLPVVAAVLALAAVLGGGLYWAANASNAVSVQRQARMVRQALHASVDQLAQNQEGAAVWDDSFDEMRRGARNVQWLDDNVGSGCTMRTATIASTCSIQRAAHFMQWWAARAPIRAPTRRSSG